MAGRNDAVTRWWRGVSLRAKVTAVIVAVLAVGLFATGMGAMVFLRNALIANLDQQLVSLAQADVVTGLIEIEVTAGVATFTEKDDATLTDYFVAVYAPGEDGAFEISAGGRGPAPDFPESFTLQQTVMRGEEPFPLSDSETGAQFHASVAAFDIPGTSELYTQMVALPLAPIDRVLTTFLGIFSILALVTIIGAALLSRWAVTLAFRGLGQVESTAAAIAAGDFSQRMTDIEPGTEVGRLKTAINTMLNRVDAALSQRDATVRQMRRFIGDASHELRTPLVSVRGYAELYRMGAIRGEEDTAQAMDRIEKEATRMGVLVEDLLSLARLDERRDVVIGPVDLRPVARDAALDVRAAAPQRAVAVIDTTAPSATDSTPPAPQPAASDAESAAARRRGGPPTSAIARAGATLSLLRRKPRPVPASRATTAADAGATDAGATDAAPDTAPIAPMHLVPVETPTSVATPPVVLGDENRIRQVVANLLTNARRYTPDDSPVELVIGVDDLARMGWIAVVDHGEGIPQQIREQIFQRFWRADSSRTRETGGSGLGLSIVASIVDALHGTVVVEETTGGGATFRVAFPLASGRSATEHLLIETQPLTRVARETD